jgi:hypothetical protein
MDIDDGMEPTLSELLDDPLIRTLMRSDGVDRASLESLMARTAAALARRSGFAACGAGSHTFVAAAAE